MTTELTCKELVELVTDYIEGALPAEAHARVDEHLSGCQGCRNFLAQMRQTVRVTGRLREEDLSAQQRDELLELFRNWNKN